MSHARDIVPAPLRPAARAVWHSAYRTSVRCRCWWEDRAHPPSRSIPPALLRFRVGGTTSLVDFQDVGRRTADNIDAALTRAGVDMAQVGTALDFGCGCGRTIRWMLPRYPGIAFAGCDVDRDAVAWCGSNLPGARFVANSPDPPLPLEQDTFDFVYAVSVFTHLDEAAQFAWLAELKRVLRPGGIALVTVHGEKTWAGTDVEADTRNSGFLFRRTGKLAGFCPDWYQTAYHTKDYVIGEFSKWFRIAAYVDGGMGFQDAIVLENPR